MTLGRLGAVAVLRILSMVNFNKQIDESIMQSLMTKHKNVANSYFFCIIEFVGLKRNAVE